MDHTADQIPTSLAAAACLACAGALAGIAPAVAAEWEFTPLATAGVHWTDNVTAVGDGAEESEWITELSPGFRLGLMGPRAEMNLAYNAQALWYKEKSEFDDIYHKLYGTGAFVFVPNHFFLDASASYGQENIDPGGRITSGNLLRTGNRTDAALLGLSPWYQTRFGQWGETTLRYRYQGVNYSNTDPTDLRVQDSDTHGMSARLGSQQGKPGLSWDSRVSYSRTEFDSGREFEYGQAALDLGVPVGLRSRVTGTVGIESDVATDPAKGGFDESFWYLGYQWEPTELQRLEVRVGDRFYGSAYEFSWTRTGSRGDLSVAYTETPTTANQRLFDGEGGFVGSRPGSAPIDTGVYLSKNFNARATYKLVRTRLSADLYAESRDRLGNDPDAPSDDDVWGVRLGVDWDAAVRTVVDFNTRYENRESDAGSESDYLELSAGLRRELTQTFFTQLRVYHVRRDSELGADYNVNAASLYIGAEF
jgi:hypothetical protein